MSFAFLSSLFVFAFVNRPAQGLARLSRFCALAEPRRLLRTLRTLALLFVCGSYPTQSGSRFQLPENVCMHAHTHANLDVCVCAHVCK